MPRFYFHLRNDIVTNDEEGAELPDLTSARRTAVETARGLAAESVRQGHLNLNHYIEIENEYGHVIATVTFREAVKIEG